ncbi:MAG: DUF4112 domain-containing protein [Fibrobacteria bacterium]
MKPKVEVGRWQDREQRAGGDQGIDPRLNPRKSGDAGSPLGQLEALAWMLDSSIAIPGTAFRIGLDSLIGLIPVIGDAIGMALSSYILFMSAKLGVPRVTLLRMGFNVALEGVVGLIPLAGDLFDMAWKANRRNVDLLRAHLDNPGRARKGDWLFAALLILGLIALLGLLALGGFALGRAVLGLFSAR